MSLKLSLNCAKELTIENKLNEAIVRTLLKYVLLSFTSDKKHDLTLLYGAFTQSVLRGVICRRLCYVINKKYIFH